jgi:hypothetical protein
VNNLSDADDPEALLDHHAVAWDAVRRSRYWMHQRFQ